MFKKKLKTVLQEYQGYNVKICAVSSFFYCGKCDKDIYEILEQIDNEYIDFFTKQLEKMNKKSKKYQSEKRKLLSRKPFIERNVLETLDSIFEPNTKIIYITGNEKGKYWTIEEYNEAHQPPEKRKRGRPRIYGD